MSAGDKITFRYNFISEEGMDANQGANDVAFYAVGAYSYALLAQYFDLGFWLCLPFAGIMAAFAGILLGFPVLRLRGDYLAIVTLGFGEMIRIILLNWYTFTNGPDGISGIPRPTFFGISKSSFEMAN